MKVVASWLREFVDVTAPPEELGQRLTMVGFELSSVETLEEDAVLDFEIWANRPDCLSVIGLAREAATVYSLPMRPPKVSVLTKGQADVKVSLEEPDLCPRYSAAVVDVTVGPSPEWLAGRLKAAGIRPINNVVDVTNYVLLEIGQPMHAFDLARLGGSALRIRRATTGERIRTLDGVDRALDGDMLVIADADKAQAVAGVMGGGLSEVGAGTRTIVLESACFQPRTVRLTSRKLGLKTEASARFERGTDINAPVMGIERAIALLEDIGAGRVRGSLVDEYPRPLEPRALNFRRARIERVLGQPIADADVDRILTGLGFTIAGNGQGWHVTVPTFRVDVSREIDLIEEIGRHHGYDGLPSAFPALDTLPGPPDPRIARDGLARRALLAAGCSEALTFTFIDTSMGGGFLNDSETVPIGNPLSAQFSILRPSLLPGLLSAIAHNRNRERTDIRLFEIGATFTRKGEARRVGIAWVGDASPSHWSGGRRNVDFFDVKGLVERVGEILQVELLFDGDHLPPYLVRSRSSAVISQGDVAGAVGMLDPAIVARAGLAAGEDVYVAELDLDRISEARPTRSLTVTPIPRYPSIARDISIVVDATLPAATVRGTIRSAAPATLVSVREFDRYQGKGVPDGRVSLSLRLTFRSPERTLTDAEVETAMKTILGALKQAHDAVQR